MAQVSQRVMHKVVRRRMEELFTSSILFCRDTETTEQLLYDLLTPTERVVLSKRFSIAFMLLQGYRYETIRHVLKVSYTTVGTVSAWLQYEGEGFRAVVAQIRMQDEVEEKWQRFMDVIDSLYLKKPGADWAGGKRDIRRKRREREHRF